LLAHVWVRAALKYVALRVFTSTERAASVPGYWLPRHVWHMPLEGHVLIPDLARPVFQIQLKFTLKMFHLCDSGIGGMVHSASMCGMTLYGCTQSRS